MSILGSGEWMMREYKESDPHHSSRHGSSQELPRLVHSTCASSAPALETHNVQVLDMYRYMWARPADAAA